MSGREDRSAGEGQPLQDEQPRAQRLPAEDQPQPVESAAADEDEGQSLLAGVASSLAGAAGPVVSAARGPIDNLASGARRMIGDRSGARVRRVRRMARRPLSNLWEVHPEAHRASKRELGLRSVPVEQIAGTAVQGPAQRGGDYLPLRDRRGDDWRARWQRILRAIDALQNLPPIELIKFGDEYWVVDGHNRVAAALYNGQVEIDAEVHELRVPGVRSEPSSFMAPVLEGSLDLRAAGEGRLTRTAQRPSQVPVAPPPAPPRDDPDEPEIEQPE